MEVEQLQEIAKPCGAFSVFYPETKEDERLKVFVGYLMKKDRYVSDELRNYDTLWQLVFQMFYGKELNLIFEVGDFQGLVGFMNIIPGWKCSVMLKLWDKEMWKKSHVRDGKKLVDRIFNGFDLIRIEGNSPDPKIVKIAEMFGFSEEGHKYKGFKWDGKVFDITLLSKLKEA